MKTIDEYLAKVTPSQRIEMERIRKIVRETVPEAEETISYDMPTFKLHGKQLFMFAAFKNHMSIFGNVDEIADKLEGFTLSGHGTLQFTEAKPLPESVIREIIALRRAQILKV